MQNWPNRLWITVFILGWVFDFLFWNQSPGISFAIFSGLTLTAGFILLQTAGKKPAAAALWLVPLIVFFTVMTFVRREPMTVFLAHLFTLFLMAVLALTYQGGRWLRYSLSDYVAKLLQLGVNLLVLPGSFAVETRRKADESESPAPRRRVWPVVRGLLLAIPVVAVFASLLSSADLVFAQRLDDFIELFRLENLPEYIFRMVYIFFIGYALAGVYLYAERKSQDETLLGLDKPLVPRFFGFTEAAIVLGSVVALFAIFVVIQFQYFFGGQANIAAEGFTYSDYARRGFGELVTVAFFSLLLFLGLSAVVKRETGQQKTVFAGLGIAMVVLVGVMLVSAFQRLILYETAYGFTRLRTYTHVFMIWLGLLLAAVVVLDVLNRQRVFALAALMAALGFALSMNLMNVDGFIARQNIQRAVAGEELDVGYLASLSTDALPTLVDLYRSPEISPDIQGSIGAVLACHRALPGNKVRSSRDWRSFNLADRQAGLAWEQVETDIKQYLIRRNEYNWPYEVVDDKGEAYPCDQTWVD